MKNSLKTYLVLYFMLFGRIALAQSTPNGTSVASFVVYYAPLIDDEINFLNGLVGAQLPNAIQLEGPTSSYNCHGYAWIKYDGGNSYWLRTPGDDQFWLDNSYVQTSNTVGEGLRVSYQGDHSAVVTSTPGVCTSKWGSAGLYRHNTTYVPAGYLPSQPLTYYGRCVNPNLQTMTYDWGNTVNTINFISSGGHNISTNIPSNALLSPINWNPSNPNAYFSPNGTNNVYGTFYLNSGQSVTFNMSANGYCGSGSRNPTFVAQSGYRLYSNSNVKDILYVGFDNVEYLEVLPVSISIHDEGTGNQELMVNIEEIFAKKQFDSEKKMAIDVKKLKRGSKILNFTYPKLDAKEKGVVVIKSDRIILVD